MELLAYEPVGDGVCCLPFACVGIVGLLGWFGFWLLHRFRASRPVSPFGRVMLWMGVAGVIVVGILFPPCRPAGDWRDETTGRTVSPVAAHELDRFTFGWAFTHEWVGGVGAEDRRSSGYRVCLAGSNRWASCDKQRKEIDWFAVAIECAVLTMLLLPFIRAKRSVPPAEASNTSAS